MYTDTIAIWITLGYSNLNTDFSFYFCGNLFKFLWVVKPSSSASSLSSSSELYPNSEGFNCECVFLRSNCSPCRCTFRRFFSGFTIKQNCWNSSSSRSTTYTHTHTHTNYIKLNVQIKRWIRSCETRALILQAVTPMLRGRVGNLNWFVIMDPACRSASYTTSTTRYHDSWHHRVLY